jgi:hypothetical protein
MSADGSAKPPEEVTPVDRLRLFRSELEHEDGQIAQRIAWLVNSQAFMFTAYAITTLGLRSNPPPPPDGTSIFPGQVMLLFRLLPLVAIFTALLIYASILAGFRAIRELRRVYQATATVPEGFLFQPSISTRLLGLVAPTLLPLLFVVVWSVLLIHSFHWAATLQLKSP